MIIPKKLPKDPNQRAHAVARMLTEGPNEDEVLTKDSLRRTESGRKGGKKGGKRRAKLLPPSRRSEIAAKAARARWTGIENE